MFENNFWSALKARIDQEVQEKAGHLIDGRAATLEDYRSRVAYIRALRDVKDWAKDVLSPPKKKDEGNEDANRV